MQRAGIREFLKFTIWKRAESSRNKVIDNTGAIRWKLE